MANDPSSSPPSDVSPSSSPIKRTRYRDYSERGVPRTTLSRWVALGLVSNPVDAEQSGSLHSEASFEDLQPHVHEDELTDNSYHESPLSDCETTSDGSVQSDSTSVDSDISEQSISGRHSDGIVSEDSGGSISSNDGDDTDDNEVNEEEGSQHLFNGSDKTINDAVLELLDLFLSQRWSKESLKKTLKTFISFLPQPNNMPSSLHSLLKWVESKAPPVLEKKYIYCSQCLNILEDCEVSCKMCSNNKKNCFYELPIAAQLKHLFETSDLADVIDSYRLKHAVAEDEGITDILNGSEYHKIKLDGPYDLTLLWNTDGVSLSASSKVNLWPLQCVICEVPPHLRSRFLIVCAVWCDDKKPHMNFFLKPFAEALKVLYEHGIQWSHPIQKTLFVSRVIAPIVCADAPARAQIQHIQQYNGKYGCGTCEQKSVQLQLSPMEALTRKKRKRRFVFQEDEARLRYGRVMDRQGAAAECKQKTQKGVKGPAVISDIPMLDRAVCVIPEYMHSVLLGVVKHFTSLMFFTRGPWYIGNCVQAVDKFLGSIQVPDFVTRLPRGVSELKTWKAKELRAWLLYYSLPVLSEFLPPHYVQHWILLVSAIFRLLKDKVSPVDVEVATVMLRLFVRDIKSLYRMSDYTYNVHQLLHLGLCVERWGPLWATSAFMFESYNGVLCRLIHGTKHHGKELINNIKITLGVQILRSSVRSRHEQLSVKDDHVLGKPVLIHMSEEEKTILSSAGFNKVTVYTRVFSKSALYTSKVYDERKKRSNCFVKYESPHHAGYGQILYYIKSDQDDIFCMVSTFSINHALVLFHTSSLCKIQHIIPVEETTHQLVFPLRYIVSKVMKVGRFICTRPNQKELNL